MKDSDIERLWIQLLAIHPNGDYWKKPENRENGFKMFKKNFLCGQPIVGLKEIESYSFLNVNPTTQSTKLFSQTSTHPAFGKEIVKNDEIADVKTKNFRKRGHVDTEIVSAKALKTRLSKCKGRNLIVKAKSKEPSQNDKLKKLCHQQMTKHFERTVKDLMVKDLSVVPKKKRGRPLKVKSTPDEPNVLCEKIGLKRFKFVVENANGNDIVLLPFKKPREAHALISPVNLVKIKPKHKPRVVNEQEAELAQALDLSIVGSQLNLFQNPHGTQYGDILNMIAENRFNESIDDMPNIDDDDEFVATILNEQMIPYVNELQLQKPDEIFRSKDHIEELVGDISSNYHDDTLIENLEKYVEDAARELEEMGNSTTTDNLDLSLTALLAEDLDHVSIRTPEKQMLVIEGQLKKVGNQTESETISQTESSNSSDLNSLVDYNKSSTPNDLNNVKFGIGKSVTKSKQSNFSKWDKLSESSETSSSVEDSDSHNADMPLLEETVLESGRVAPIPTPVDVTARFPTEENQHTYSENINTELPSCSSRIASAEKVTLTDLEKLNSTTSHEMSVVSTSTPEEKSSNLDDNIFNTSELLDLDEDLDFEPDDDDVLSVATSWDGDGFEDELSAPPNKTKYDTKEEKTITTKCDKSNSNSLETLPIDSTPMKTTPDLAGQGRGLFLEVKCNATNHTSLQPRNNKRVNSFIPKKVPHVAATTTTSNAGTQPKNVSFKIPRNTKCGNNIESSSSLNSIDQQQQQQQHQQQQFMSHPEQQANRISIDSSSPRLNPLTSQRISMPFACRSVNSQQTPMGIGSMVASQQTPGGIDSIVTPQQTPMGIGSIATSQQTPVGIGSIATSQHTPMGKGSILTSQQTPMGIGSIGTPQQITMGIGSIGTPQHTPMGKGSILTSQQTPMGIGSIGTPQQIPMGIGSIGTPQHTPMGKGSILTSQQTPMGIGSLVSNVAANCSPNVSYIQKVNMFKWCKDIFGISCNRFHEGNCSGNCKLSHELHSAGEIQNSLFRLNKIQLKKAYIFVKRYKILFEKTTKFFVANFAIRKQIDDIIFVIEDCRLYPNSCELLLLPIHDSLGQCGLSKVDACRAILARIFNKTNLQNCSKALDKITDLIILSGWKNFFNCILKMLPLPAYKIHPTHLATILDDTSKARNFNQIKKIVEALSMINVSRYEENVPKLKELLMLMASMPNLGDDFEETNDNEEPIFDFQSFY